MNGELTPKLKNLKKIDLYAFYCCTCKVGTRDDTVHAQKVENMWKQLKRTLERQFGKSHYLFQKDLWLTFFSVFQRLRHLLVFIK